MILALNSRGRRAEVRSWCCTGFAPPQALRPRQPSGVTFLRSHPPFPLTAEPLLISVSLEAAGVTAEAVLPPLTNHILFLLLN